MKTFRNTIVLFTLMVSLFCMAQMSFASNTGPVHALEGLFGGKYSGAPSQALAGRMGMMFREIKDDLALVNIGKIVDPAPIHELGYPEIQADDEIQMTRTGENTWKIKHVKSGKTFTVKVVS